MTVWTKNIGHGAFLVLGYLHFNYIILGIIGTRTILAHDDRDIYLSLHLSIGGVFLVISVDCFLNILEGLGWGSLVGVSRSAGN